MLLEDTSIKINIGKVIIKIERTNISDKILSQYLYYFNPFLRSNSSISFKLIDSRSALFS